MRREPVVTAAFVVSFVQAVFVALMAFDMLDWTEDQKDAIMAVVVLSAPLVAAWITRSLVTPTADPRDSSGNPLYPESVLDSLTRGAMNSSAGGR